MKKTLFFTLFITLLSLSSFAQSSKYKCMIQMIGYKGEAAYVIISLINPQGAYEKTLAVLGPDKQWYNTLKEWYKFETKAKSKLSTITGASVNGGDRAVRTIEIEDSRSEEHTSELQSRENLVCRLLLEKKNMRQPCALPKRCKRL